MSILEFFDVTSPAHLRAYRYLRDHGEWSEIFHEMIKINKVWFPPCWQVAIASKLADEYINLKLGAR